MTITLENAKWLLERRKERYQEEMDENDKFIKERNRIIEEQKKGIERLVLCNANLLAKKSESATILEIIVMGEKSKKEFLEIHPDYIPWIEEKGYNTEG